MAEGPTDGVVIEAALRAIVGVRVFRLTQLQPEESAAFGPVGTGWVGVYRWCKQAAISGKGRLSTYDLLFQHYDLLILHLDAAVAACRYDDGSIAPAIGDGTLPCARPCPPVASTTNRLRKVLLSWCGESAMPPKTVFCVPSKSTEAWLVAALFPDDAAVKAGIECHASPAVRLSQQPKSRRIQKRVRDYQAVSSKLQAAWDQVVGPRALVEARRFHADVARSLRLP